MGPSPPTVILPISTPITLTTTSTLPASNKPASNTPVSNTPASNTPATSKPYNPVDPQTLPNLGQDDTYQWSDVQPVRVAKPMTKLSPGQVYTFKTSIHSIDPQEGTILNTFQVKRSNKWFSISDCTVNDNGDLIIQIATGSNMTPTGRVVRLYFSWVQSTLSTFSTPPGNVTLESEYFC